MTALRTENIDFEFRRLKDLGLTDSHPRKWTRRLHMDSKVPVSFSTMMLRADFEPLTGFFYCQHHDRGKIFDPKLAIHDNGALAIRRALIVTPELAKFERAYRHFFGDMVLQRTTSSIVVTLGSQALEVHSGTLLKNRYPGSSPSTIGSGSYFFGMEILVQDVDKTCSVLGSNGVRFHRIPGSNYAWVEPSDACGTLVTFIDSRSTGNSQRASGSI